MPIPPLFDAAALADFPGAPFSSSVVAAAESAIRAAAGWHIAPQINETVAVESDGGCYLFVPTLWLDSVTAIRDVTNDDAVIAFDDVQTARTPRFRAGCLHRASAWPMSVVELDIVHGLDECPPELLALAASLCQSISRDRSITQQTEGPFSVAYSAASQAELEASPLLARYRIPQRA